jgi:hypothetical protein
MKVYEKLFFMHSQLFVASRNNLSAGIAEAAGFWVSDVA